MDMWIKFLYLCILLSLALGFFAFLSFRKSPSFFGKTAAFLKILLFVSLASVIFWTTIHIRKYELFGRERVVAHILCRKIGNEQMELVLKRQDRRDGEEKFILRGDQWMIGGEILRWKKPLYFLGMNSLYKLSRIGSRYLKVERESLTTHFELSGGTDGFWLFFYRNQRFFPFIEAVYGNCAYTFPKDKTLFKLYVNQTGYFIKEEPGK